MTKPLTLQHLLVSGGCSLGEIRNIAKDLFSGDTGAGPEGYVVTLPVFDELPDHIQQFVIKAIAMSKVENVLDAAEAEDERTELEQRADEEAEAAREELGLEKEDFGEE